MTRYSTIISYLQRNAQGGPTHTAVSDTRQTLTYQDLWEKSRAMGAWLNAHGYGKGDRILIEAFPAVSFVVTAMGIYLAGCVFVPVEKKFSTGVAERYIKETNARLFIGNDKVDGLTCITSDHVMEMPRIGTAMDSLGNAEGENSIADILYTTGTTGQSKGVILSHRALLASSDNNRSVDCIDTEAVYLIASPLNHISALRKLYACLLAGAHAILLDGFMDVKHYYETIDAYRVSHLLLPPLVVHFLLAVSKAKLQALHEQIKVVHSNGSSMTEMDKERLCQCLPSSKLILGYGATEGGSSCVSYNYAKYPGMQNCVGKPSPHSQVSIVDEHHRVIQSSKENQGTLAISGETIMDGYLNAPELTADVLKEGWLYTNDYGYIDSNGFIFVTGRKGDIINCGGLKIAPSEVENVAMKYSGIRDCACFGGQNSLGGTTVKLNIVLEKESDFDIMAFCRFLRSQLESHQVPTQIQCVNDIPRTHNGKIDRKRLGTGG